MSVEESSRPAAATARGVRLRKEERRAQLLDVAREVFVSQGYHAASMDSIADAAGITKPVLYQHFPGKLELYLALLDDGIATLIARLRHALDSTTDNRLRVAGTIAAYLDFVSSDDGAFRLVFESDLTSETAVRERLDRSNDECASMISEVIAADTGFSPAQAMLLAAGLQGQAQTAARHWLRGSAEVSKDEATRLILSLSWKGISSFPLSHPPLADGATTDNSD